MIRRSTHNFFISAILVVATFSGTSCSEEVAPTPYTYSQIFSGKNSKTWVFKSIVLWREGKSEIAYTLPSCMRDDRYIFYANNEKLYEVTNGPTKCSPDEPEVIYSDSWSFINAGATLTIAIPFLADQSLPFTVREISSKNMLLEIFINFELTESYRIGFESIAEN
jgi:hypothetical protein